MHNQTRKITEGAMMIAILGVFMLINRQTVGLLDSYFAWLLPLPVIFYTVKYGVKAALPVSFSIILLSFMLALPGTIFFVAISSVLGILYGYGVCKDKGNEWLLVMTTLLTSFMYFVSTYLLASLIGYNVSDEVKLIIAYFESMGIKDLSSNLYQTLLMLFPLVIFMTALIQSILTHITAISMMKRLKIKVLPMRPLSQIMLPKWLGWLCLVALFPQAIANRMGASTDITLITTLIFSVSSMILFFDAYVLIIIFAKKIKQRFLPAIFILLFLMMPVGFVYFYIVLGLLDILTDLRRRVITLTWR